MNTNPTQKPALRRLANEPNGSSKLEPYSSKASAAATARALDLLAEIQLGTEPLTQRQSDVWMLLLQDYRPRLIDQAFYRWAKISKHMPVPSEIITILEELREAEAEAAKRAEDTARIAECRETRRQLTEAGEPSGLEQYRAVMGEALQRIHSFPAFPDPNRRVELKERLARAERERAARKKPAVPAEGVWRNEATA
jgi:hypothetical protein